MRVQTSIRRDIFHGLSPEVPAPLQIVGQAIAGCAGEAAGMFRVKVPYEEQRIAGIRLR